MGGGRIAVLAATLCVAPLPVHAANLIVSLTPGGSSNQLAISTAAGSPLSYMAFESGGTTIGDRVSVFFPAGLQFTSLSVSSGWASTVGAGASGGVATYYFQGGDAGNNFERHDFAVPLTATFGLRSRDPAAADRAAVRVETALTVGLPGGGFARSFGQTAGTAAVEVVPIPEPDTRAVVALAAGLYMVAMRGRRRGARRPIRAP